MISLKTSYSLYDRAFIVLMAWLIGHRHASEQPVVTETASSIKLLKQKAILNVRNQVFAMNSKSAQQAKSVQHSVP